MPEELSESQRETAEKHASSCCPVCEGTGVIVRAFDTGRRAWAYKEVCACALAREAEARAKEQ